MSGQECHSAPFIAGQIVSSLIDHFINQHSHKLDYHEQEML
jgi:hypothetical protein